MHILAAPADAAAEPSPRGPSSLTSASPSTSTTSSSEHQHQQQQGEEAAAKKQLLAQGMGALAQRMEAAAQALPGGLAAAPGGPPAGPAASFMLHMALQSLRGGNPAAALHRCAGGNSCVVGGTQLHGSQ